MGIKITYTDTITGNVMRETTLDDEDVKAFEYVAYNPLEWIDNCFQNRARQAIDEVVGEALGNNKDVVITDADKTAIAAKVGVVAKVKDIDVVNKKDIVRKANFDSAKTKTDRIEGGV